MGKVTLVFEYEDGKEPPVHFGMEYLGGKIVSAAFFDYRDNFLNETEQEIIAECLDRETLDTQQKLMAKLDLLTQ